jgi:hypothetical protein
MKNYKEIQDFYLSKSLHSFDSFIEKEMIPGAPIRNISGFLFIQKIALSC